MNFGSLFSGIGGLELGLERAGFEPHRWYSEIDPFCVQVHEKHWPGVPNLGDVTEVDWESVERVDLICGGYPCQPFSLAGSRGGTDDARHLWPYFRDALSVLRPRYALLENVPGHLSLGFGDVLADLADLGYDTEWDCLPATAVGAPHLRYRVFIVAYSPLGWGNERRHQADPRPDRTERLPAHAGRSGRALADADGPARDGSWRASQTILGRGAVKRLGRCRSGLGEFWAVEPDVGRVAHGVPRRLDRLRALGNAVVPQVAEFVGRQILEQHRATELDARTVCAEDMTPNRSLLVATNGGPAVNCSTCRHSVEGPGDPNNLGAPRQLECRLNPPQATAIATPQGLVTLACFPVVTPALVCSQHEHKPVRLEAVER